MRQKYADIPLKKIIDCVNESDSIPEVVRKLGFDPNIGNTRKNIERLIKRNGISIEHFSTVKRVRETKKRYNKERLIELMKTCNSFKEILESLDLIPIYSNYKTLKKYLNNHNIDYSHLNKNIVRQPSIDSKYSKDFFIKIIKTSITYREVFNKLGISNRGNNYKTIKKYIKLYDIDISHFNSKKVSIEKLLKSKCRPIEYYLISGSTIGSNVLKKKLYKERLKNPICELCGQDENWNGKKMSLILDHINGVSNDNRIENLRIVCPNCNATLPTHCGKNIKQKKKIKIHKYCNCGEIITNKANKCENCQQLNRRKVERPPYEQLLEEINKLGYTGTGRKYGVSDNAIRKWKKYYEK